MMMKRFIAFVCVSSLALAGEYLYTATYIPNAGIVHPYIKTGIPNQVAVDELMKKRVVFSASLYFEDGRLDSASQNSLQKLLKNIDKNGSEAYFVSLVGHTSALTSEDHSISLNFWSSMWHNLGNHSISRDRVAQRINQHIRTVYSLLKDRGVDTDKIYTENRMDRDPISTEATKDGRKLNRRVTVTLYY